MDLRALFNGGVFIDARDEVYYNDGHIKNAMKNVFLMELIFNIEDKQTKEDFYIDLKTTKRKPSGLSMSHAMQQSIYQRGTNANQRLWYLIANKSGAKFGHVIVVIDLTSDLQKPQIDFIKDQVFSEEFYTTYNPFTKFSYLLIDNKRLQQQNYN